MSAEALSVDAAISGYREAKVSKGQLIAALTLAGATAVGAAAFVSSIDSSHGTPREPGSQGRRTTSRWKPGLSRRARSRCTSSISKRRPAVVDRPRT